MADLSTEELMAYDGEYEVRLKIGGNTFGMPVIRSISTANQLCDLKFEIGKTACGQIDAVIEKPSINFGRMAQIIPYTKRIDCDPEGEWQQRGVYYIDTRVTEIDGGYDLLHITGFDGMLRTSKDYGNLGLTYPAKTLNVVKKIAELSGLEVEAQTQNILNDGQTIPEPEYYTGREILGFVAVMYGGSFMMDRFGRLKLVNMANLLTKDEIITERILSNRYAVPIEVGGVLIVV